MRKELAKNYNPQDVEDRIYAGWLEKKIFHAEADPSRKPYTIVIPPPNITGQLHMGHALDCTLQDILIRFKRMQGYNALWLPGTDHASISTEVKIVAKMAEEGLHKEDVGREEFLRRAWDWKAQYGGRILQQLKKFGSSCDWDRERFTMDEGLSKAVTEVFIRLYRKGLIYRGEKLVNWCPKCQTTISDAEVDHPDRQGVFYYMKYPVSGGGFIPFATTRPETILGDTAVAVNPKDERYAGYVGKTVTVPFVDREIPIIADPYVEMDFGTGAVKITPGHDPNDYEMGERHGLPVISVMNDDGTMNAAAGRYEGLDRYEARKRIVEDFQSLGLFIRQEEMNHAVGVHERCKETVEPLIKLQWFVKMKELAEPAIRAYHEGQPHFVPERFGKIYLSWLENIRDWCISRQLWWGHRIPAYYCEECGHIAVWSKEEREGQVCPQCGSAQLRQEEDTLDTWFSSALWPFSTLGWPDQTKDLEYFYPTDVLVTAYDIIFFWVVRMAFSGLEHTGKVPFKDVFIHGLIRDSQGVKMSKSLGNGIDPLDLIEQYGADALRMTLITGNSPGNDLRFYPEKMEPNRNFLNKIWNATRFVLMNMDETEPAANRKFLEPSDRWILSRVNSLAKEVTENLDHYELGLAVQKIYDFIWDEYCDWYIEMVKPRLYNREDPKREAALWTLKTVLINAMKLLHPFMPFITEEIYTALQTADENQDITIMRSDWPVFSEDLHFPKEEKEIGLIQEAVRRIRNTRADMHVPPSQKVKVWVVAENENLRKVFENGKQFFGLLAAASEVLVQETREGVDEDAVAVVVPDATVFIPFAELVDLEKERQRLEKEINRLEKEINRVDQKLSNEGFVQKAPDKVIAEEKEKQEKYSSMLEQAKLRLESLKK